MSDETRTTPETEDAKVAQAMAFAYAIRAAIERTAAKLPDAPTLNAMVGALVSELAGAIASVRHDALQHQLLISSIAELIERVGSYTDTGDPAIHRVEAIMAGGRKQ